jgi:hypothetical protein
MLIKDALSTLDKRQAYELWQKRLDSVDNIISNSTSAWSLDFWTKVRRQLVRQVNLLYASYKEN